MFKRLMTWWRQFFIVVDQVFGVILSGPFFILLGWGSPSADETISSIVGRLSIEGWKWAKIAEKVINFIAMLLGDDPDHCFRSIEWDEQVLVKSKVTVE